ncbi:MAG: flagellar filament capping protein FliD [Thermoguttaceae bacterium]
MGRIQTTTGLITGVQIAQTVEALMKLAARPRDLLSQRTQTLQEQQLAVTELSALLLAVRYVTENLGKPAIYQKRQIASSNESVLAATVTGEPAPGVYRFTPVRMAQYHELVSTGLASDQDPLGPGTLTFRFGDHVQRSVGLDLLGGGLGLVRGRIRITDRSGASAEIDLTAAQTLEDVLEAINSAPAIQVIAESHGDRIRLIDQTGQTTSNLKVQEVGQGRTAASLGLAGIDVAAQVADGDDLLRLTPSTPLAVLNDGNGVLTSTVLPDIAYTLRDGTTGTIDLSPIVPGGSTVLKETTLGEILQRINQAEPGKLRAEIAADGDRLVLTDLTSGSGSFTLQSLYDSNALADLGLDRPAFDGLITGRRLLGGLQGVLLSSLNGGKGFGQLGLVRLTDRSGASATVDLAAAETLADLLAAINAAGIGISARVNDARNGILLTDTTGAAGNLVVADADATQTATRLNLAADIAGTSVNSGDLHLKVVSQFTPLSDLNGGAGVARGRLTIYNSKGERGCVDLATENIQTIGELIRAINRLSLDVRAELNETGDGIALIDFSNGSGRLRVEDPDSTAVADLHLDRAAVDRTVEGSPAQVLDGSITETIQLDSGDSLLDLKSKIEQANAGLTARILNDGSSRPYRLVLSSQRSGRVGQLVVDASGLGLGLAETGLPRDALLLLGAPGTAGAQFLLSSPTDQFTSALPGATLRIKQASSTPVTLLVDNNDADFLASVRTMVENYNKFRKKLLEDTAYDVQTGKGSVLTGDAAALRLDTELSYLLSGSFLGAGSIRSLAELGIGLKDDGTLELDEAKLKTRLAEDREAVRQFFTAEGTGFSDRLVQLLDELGSEQNSLLSRRLDVLDRKIEDNQTKIALLDKSLQTQRDRLYLEFYRMELAVSKLQNSLNALSAIQYLEPLGLRDRNG